MCKGGGGQNTVVQQSSPPPQFLAAYQNAVNQAQNVASVPYQSYSGNTVAPLSPDQNAGISAVENSYGTAAPYINSAAGYIGNSTAPLWPGIQQFSPSAVSQYESPYTNQVVNATQAEFNNQNAQQANQLRGSAAAAGALGGDREAVAQGVLAGQQQLAQAPVIAGLQNQGYTQALGELNQQQQLQLGANEANAWLNSQAGYGMANLGNEAQNSSLAGANALLGVGGLEQQQAQQLLNVPYEQFLGAQAYPFQTTGWLSGISEGLGGASGGSSSSSYPGASVGSQILGTGIAGVGALGLTGAFGNAGWLTGADGLFGSGAGVLSDAGLAAESGAAASGIVPAGIDAGLMAVRRGGMIPHRSADVIPFPRRAHGGMAPVNDNWDGDWPEQRRASGGSTQVTIVPGSYIGSPGIPQLSPMHITPGAAPMTPSATAGNLGMGMGAPSANPAIQAYLANTMSGASFAPPQGYVAPPPSAAPPPGPAPVPPQPGFDQFGNPLMTHEGTGAAGGPVSRLADGGSPDDDPFALLGTVPEAATAEAPPPAAPAIQERAPDTASHGMRPSQTPSGAPWKALTDIGLGIMGGTSPNALTNVGRGALQGLKQYDTERQADALTAFREQQGQAAAGRQQEQHRHNVEDEQTAAKRIADQAEESLARIKQGDARLAIEGGHLAESERHNRVSEGQGRWIAGYGLDANGNQVPGLLFAGKEGEDPTFHPGVTTAQIASQGIRKQALDETIKQHGIANDQRAQAQLQGQIKSMTDEAVRLYLGSRDPLTGKFGMTPQQAQDQAGKFRSGAADASGATTAAPSAPTAPVPPKPGEVRDGYTFKGGNPADPNSWQAVQ